MSNLRCAGLILMNNHWSNGDDITINLLSTVGLVASEGLLNLVEASYGAPSP